MKFTGEKNPVCFHCIGFPVSYPAGIPRISGRHFSCQEVKMGAGGSCGSGKYQILQKIPSKLIQKQSLLTHYSSN